MENLTAYNLSHRKGKPPLVPDTKSSQQWVRGTYEKWPSWAATRACSLSQSCQAALVPKVCKLVSQVCESWGRIRANKAQRCRCAEQQALTALPALPSTDPLQVVSVTGHSLTDFQNCINSPPHHLCWRVLLSSLASACCLFPGYR